MELDVFKKFLHQYLKSHGFTKVKSKYYLKGNKFTSLLDGKGIRLLKKIKNRYFSDTFKKLWNLLYLFFDYESKCKATNNLNEVLVTKYYPAVFEDMIDSLLGDNIKDSVIPAYYKDQKDGRIVDHIYSYKDLQDFPLSQVQEMQNSFS